MYHSKKIAFFISHIYGDYQRFLTEGIISKVHEYGYPLEIYSTNDGEDLGSYVIGEESVLKIPNFDDIAGVLFAAGTYNDTKLRDSIFALLKSHPEIPVIEINDGETTFTSVSMENSVVAGELASHVINVHKASKVCYLGSRKYRYYSDRREVAFRETLLKNNLEITDECIYLCDESPEDYKNALNHFCQSGKPDAVICYNDTVALDFMECALLEGYTIPDDFIVTGFDFSDGGQNISPSLTTVSFPVKEVGIQAVVSLVNLLNNEPVSNITITAKPIYRESCGCLNHSQRNTFEYLRNRSRKITRLEKSMLSSMKMSIALSHAKDLDEGCDIIEEFIGKIDKLNEFYMCLYSDWNRLTDPSLSFLSEFDEEDDSIEDSIILKLGLKNGKRVPECTFQKKMLLPSFVSPDANKSFLITPLFFEDRALGYTAMSFEAGTINFPFHLIQWITNIAQFLQNICEGERTALIAKHLEEMYLSDPLTGLNNRHGFNRALALKDFSGKYTSVVMLDLDKLKYINDNYGHDEGDFALKTIGQALLSVSEPEDLCARFGGDEFYCILNNDDESYVETFVTRISKYLSNFSNLSDKPYQISASIGVETVPDFSVNDIPTLLKHADVKMYEIKKNRKG